MRTSPLERLLKDRSPEFQETVRALVQQYDIDETDPTFILLVGTTTLEVILGKYPQEFEHLFTGLLSQVDQRQNAWQQGIASATDTAARKLTADWQQVQSKLVVSGLESAQTAQQVTQRLAEVELLLQREREKMIEVAAAEQEAIRTQGGTQAELLTTFFKEQCNELEAQAGKLAAHAIASAQATAAKQVKEASKSIRRVHYIEATGTACACAAALMLTAWTTGWVSRGRAEDSSIWVDIERWNTEELQACVAAGLDTCNFHIGVPKPPVE